MLRLIAAFALVLAAPLTVSGGEYLLTISAPGRSSQIYIQNEKDKIVKLNIRFNYKLKKERDLTVSSFTPFSANKVAYCGKNTLEGGVIKYFCKLKIYPEEEQEPDIQIIPGSDFQLMEYRID